MSNVFLNENHLAFETMLNAAVNRHWELADSDKGEQIFQTSLPFMEDGELLRLLMNSGDPEVREIMRGIRLRKPFNNIGYYVVDRKVYEDLVDMETSDNELDSKVRRRRRFLELFDKNGCYVRITKSFGDSDSKSGRKPWLDPDRILVYSKMTEVPVALASLETQAKFFEMIRDQEVRQRRMFWLYSKSGEACKAAVKLAKRLEIGKESWQKIYEAHRPR